jgi:adenylosuccinate synthase
VLSGFDQLMVCTRYRGKEGAVFDHFPYHQSVLHHATGEFQPLEGWSEDLGECRSESDLPQAARDYIAFIEDYTGVPVVLVGVGPGRDQNVWMKAAGDTLMARTAPTAA